MSRVLSHVGPGTDTAAQQLEATGAVMAYFYNWLFVGGLAHGGWGFSQSWSLGVEEQFYLLWPLTLMLLLRWRPRRVGRVCLVVAALSVLAAVLARGVWHDYDFEYYSTVTNLSGLMLGSYLAWALHRGWSPGRWIRWAALAGLALIGVVLFSGPPWSANPLLWGDWPIDLAAAALILAVLDAAGPLGRLFSMRPLRYLGEISYSVYVWHFLVISCVLLLAPRMNPAIQIFLVLYVSLLVAMASHRLLEVPFIRLAHRGGWHRQKPPAPTAGPVERRATPRHLRPSPVPSPAVPSLSVDAG
jgi:peptidoglycan/LPS O-acetylase OafA/YrhL